LVSYINSKISFYILFFFEINDRPFITTVINSSSNDLADGYGKVVETEGPLKIAVFRVGDRCAAIDNRCPHAGAFLGSGQFDGTMVKCPLHGFRVDVWKGVGNGGKPVAKYPVAIEGDNICITIPDAPS
jgi:3-phenylpropionate/trans-cinnamate dioxygenase ferredoxin subunit